MLKALDIATGSLPSHKVRQDLPGGTRLQLEIRVENGGEA